MLATTAGSIKSLTFASRADETDTCTDYLAVPSENAEEACPVGTTLEVHSQVGSASCGQAAPRLHGGLLQTCHHPAPHSPPAPLKPCPLLFLWLQNTTNPNVPVFKYVGCAPCETGHICPTGASSACPGGTFTEVVGASTCDTCPDGRVSRPGQEDCQECAPGTTPNAGKTQCELCPAGKYSTIPGSPCLECPAGSFRFAGGGDGTNCTKCPPGTYQPLQGQAACIPCDAGYASSNEGATTCAAW